LEEALKDPEGRKRRMAFARRWGAVAARAYLEGAFDHLVDAGEAGSDRRHLKK
jgi:hypothetical protein